MRMAQNLASPRLSVTRPGGAVLGPLVEVDTRVVVRVIRSTHRGRPSNGTGLRHGVGGAILRGGRRPVRPPTAGM